MNAVSAIDYYQCVDVLKAPYNTWSAARVLRYFQTRHTIKYFAIADAEEVKREKIDSLLDNRFNFNQESYDFPHGIDWLNNPSSDIEWSIMLHKFYYAVGLGLAYQDSQNPRYVEKWLELTHSWINTTPVDFLSSDVTGRRIQNWIFAHYYFINETPNKYISGEFYQQFLASIHQQTRYLCANLTPARNHRTLELYTVFLVAVVFPELQESDHWLAFSIAELVKNIQTDVLEDGVHCELSTDYHHIVLRNFLSVKRLATLNNITLPTAFDEGIQKALQFSLYVHKPDGTIPSLSDGDTGNFLTLLQQGYEFYGDETLLYAASQGKKGIAPKNRCQAFPIGGYYILRSGWGELEPYQDERYLVFDCGPLGAGNHGHLDLLNFEMAAYGQSLIVDPGRYTYDESGDINWRVLFRSTEYHNTVLVDGKNQTNYQFHTRKFKIKGPQPNYALKAFISQPGIDYLHGIAHSHEYPVTHERKIVFVNGEYWLICDILRADEPHDYDVLFHLATSAQNQLAIDNKLSYFSIDAPHLVLMQPKQANTSLTIEQGYLSPTYGVKQKAPIAVFHQQASTCCFYSIIYPYKNKRPFLALESLPVLQQNETITANSAGYLTLVLVKNGQVYKDSIFLAHEVGEFYADAHYFNTPVFFQRQNEQGQVLKQFNYATLDRSTIFSYQEGN